MRRPRGGVARTRHASITPERQPPGDRLRRGRRVAARCRQRSDAAPSPLARGDREERL